MLRCSLASWIVLLLPAVVWWCCMNLSVLCTEHFQPAQSSSDLCYWHQKGDEFTFLTYSFAKQKKKVLNLSLAKSVTIWENIWTGRCKCKTPDGAQCVPLLVRVYIFEYIYIHVYMCMYIRVCIYICICLCVVWFFLNKTFYTWYVLPSWQMQSLCCFCHQGTLYDHPSIQKATDSQNGHFWVSRQRRDELYLTVTSERDTH